MLKNVNGFVLMSLYHQMTKTVWMGSFVILEPKSILLTKMIAVPYQLIRLIRNKHPLLSLENNVHPPLHKIHARHVIIYEFQVPEAVLNKSGVDNQTVEMQKWFRYNNQLTDCSRFLCFYIVSQ